MDQDALGLDPLPKKTGKELFLGEMNEVVPWAALVALIAPFTDSGLVHTVIGTATNVHDVTQAAGRAARR